MVQHKDGNGMMPCLVVMRCLLNGVIILERADIESGGGSGAPGEGGGRC